jgi:hypothetical protein
MCIMLGAGAMAGLQLAIGAASTVVGFMGQQQQYKAQMEMYKENAKNAQQMARDQYAHTQNRWLQERSAAGLEKQEANVEAMTARATAAAAGGEGGIQGNSLSQLLGSYYAKQGRFNDAVDQNYQMSRDYLWASMDQTKNQAQSQINSMPKPVRPSFLDAAIRIAGQGLEAATTYNQMRAV